jgi:hypothetical protein
MTHLHRFPIAALIVPGVASTASAVDMAQLREKAFWRLRTTMSRQC